MGTVPPPLRLSREEFDRRWKAGARTLFEIDPDFVAWVRRGLMTRAIGLAVGLSLSFLMILVMAITWLSNP